MSLTLRGLQQFLVLSEERHFSRAAQKLHLTQSALSRSIQALEDDVGLTLLDRDPAGVKLTQAGEMVLTRARRILAETAELQRHARRLKGCESGQVNLGVGVFPAATFLSPLLKELARTRPDIQVHVEIESWQRLREKLQHDKLDFVVAVTHSLPPPKDYTVHPLPPQHGGLFVRAGHPLLAVPPRRLRARLADYRLAATQLPQRARAYLAKLYQVADPDDLPIACECDSISTLREVAQGSDVVLFSTRESIAEALNEGSLQSLPVSLPAAASLRFSVLHHQRRTLSPAAELVLGMIQDLLKRGGRATSASTRQDVGTSGA
ncbi:LysR family transcriptional regulator [Bordetella sp. 02P26C-1]|uniref:LysR family transcriptional regulator n=1 Tax=Bordetella sp. 02P26C-1 TaxID=2683195 RepID=UPI001353A163|nr:LysR family transcriptional regulator [Bordetella sp. 02P26C-1]MVW77729.1 LysR family transcriptional regulator [Bordetella sp. 02P26C-1]